MHDLNAVRLKEPQAIRNINRVKSAFLCALFLSNAVQLRAYVALFYAQG